MKFCELETTYIGQFSKPQNKALLEAYKERSDRSPAELKRYYVDVVTILANSKAWGVSGVNKMINELTAAVRATLYKAKSGKTSAPAHANKMLNCIKHFGDTEVVARYCGRHKLDPLLTEEELELLASV